MFFLCEGMYIGVCVQFPRISNIFSNKCMPQQYKIRYMEWMLINFEAINSSSLPYLLLLLQYRLCLGGQKGKIISIKR